MRQFLLNLFCGRPVDITANSGTLARKKLLGMTPDTAPPKVTAPVK